MCNSRKIQTVLPFWYLSTTKAFDCLPYLPLLFKLWNIGVYDHALLWFGNYLTGRSQAPRLLDGRHETWLPVGKGVPQGSVLGPPPFTIFINDLPDCLYFFKPAIFADDTQISLHSALNDLSANFEFIYRDAENVSSWADRNQLLLNHDKTTIIILGTKHQLNNIDTTLLLHLFFMVTSYSLPLPSKPLVSNRKIHSIETAKSTR